MKYNLICHTTRPYSAKYLKSIYDLSNGSKEHIYACVPNGEIGISVILNGQSHTKTEQGWQKQPAISVYGLVSKVQFHKMSPHYHEINLGFNPQYLQLFLKDSLHAISKTEATDLLDLIKKDEANMLFEHLCLSRNNDEIAAAIEHFLSNNLIGKVLDKRILAAQELIIGQNVWNVENISSWLNITPTTLRNLFREQVGISPKDFIKIHRIKQALHYKFHNKESLTDLAYYLKYFDQAHFIHDFKDTIGFTPKQYFSNKQLTFDFYNFHRFSYDSFAGK